MLIWIAHVQSENVFESIMNVWHKCVLCCFCVRNQMDKPKGSCTKFKLITKLLYLTANYEECEVN